MKLAIMADVHSNLEALKVVLNDIRKREIKHILCAGDIVGYGPEPDGCIALLRKNLVVSVRGNHDDEATKLDSLDWFNNFARSALIWTNKRLTKSNREYLRKLPLTKKVGNIFMVHGSLFDPLYEYVHPKDDLLKYAKVLKTDVLIMGHTHEPFIRHSKKKLFINPGSVGQPRDNNPRASYAILDNKTLKAEIVRLSYDIDKTAKRIEEAGLPKFLAGRLYYGR